MLVSRFLSLAVAGAFAATVLAAPPQASPVTARRIVEADREPGNWLSHGRTYDEQRYSPLAQIHEGNVQQLGLAWSYKLDIDRGVEATPIVVDGVMYTTGPFSIVYALDATTGKLLWKHDPKVDRTRAGTGCCDAVNRGVAVWGQGVYVGTFDGYLVALDARTGRQLWRTDTLTDRGRNYTITGAPRIVKGQVLIGNGGAEYGVRGYVSAFDAATGKLTWRFYTVPGDPAQPDESPAMTMARKTWFGDRYHKLGGGGTVWDSMAYDPALNLVYIGVGNGGTFNPRERSAGKGDNLFLSSIVALNADTGAYVWHYQTTPGDMWDYTATQHMILAELRIDGKPRQVLMQAPKNGFFYVLDRTTGELISAEKYAPANWATGIDKTTGRALVDKAAADWSDEGKLVFPSFYGAHNWHPMSFSPRTGLVYIPQNESSAFFAPADKVPDPQLNRINTGLAPGGPPEEPKALRQIADGFKGKLLAWDPVRQREAWSVPRVTVNNGGTLVTAGNLVFQGTADGLVTAYTADSGKLLWSQPVDTGVMAGPVTYTVRGEQYVSFMAGWGGNFPLLLGAFSLKAQVQPHARVLTFKLGGKAPLPRRVSPQVELPNPPPATADERLIAKGREVFNDACAGCHGVAAVSGGVLPDLRYLSPGRHTIFRQIVHGALAPLGMPSFKEILSEDDIAAAHQYLIKRSHDLVSELRAGDALTAHGAPLVRPQP